MSKLPKIFAAELVRALQKIGFTVRGLQGSHIILRRDDPFAQTVVSNKPDVGNIGQLLDEREVGHSLLV